MKNIIKRLIELEEVSHQLEVDESDRTGFMNQVEDFANKFISDLDSGIFKFLFVF